MILPETNKSDYGLMKLQWAYLNVVQFTTDGEDLFLSVEMLRDIWLPSALGKFVRQFLDVVPD